MDGSLTMTLLEGSCPDCGGDVEISSASGTAEELGYWKFKEGTPVYPYEEKGFDVVLSLEFRCPDCGTRHCAEKYAGSGDWASG